jgi:hypothetical protein
MVAPVLSATILAAMQANILAAFPTAVPTPFQPIMANAIGTGVVNSVKMAIGLGLPGQFQAAGPSVGILGLDPASMIAGASGFILAQLGSVGVATPLILSAIFTSIIAHMQLVTVMTDMTSGFGGPIIKIDQMPASLVLANILKELPESMLAPILSSVGGKIFFEAVATGFANDMALKGKPAPLHLATSGPTGQTMARFT